MTLSLAALRTMSEDDAGREIAQALRGSRTPERKAWVPRSLRVVEFAVERGVVYLPPPGRSVTTCPVPVARVEAAQRRHVQRGRRLQRRVWNPPGPKTVFLDAPFRDDDHDRHGLHAPQDDPFDPQRYLEAELLDALVGDLSINDIQSMSDEQLRPIRERLIAAGFSPSGVQSKERERLRQSMPRRGDSTPAVTFEAMTTDFKHRKPGHRSSAGGQRSARKPRRPGRGRRREKVVW